jgi:nucleoside-diphosphate kinase
MTERTLLLVKPDGVQRGLIGEIISRWERRGFKLVAMKLTKASRELAEKHYAEHAGKSFFEKLLKGITSGPLVAMVWEGKGVIAISRSMMGATNPANSASGTVRGDFAIDLGRNVIHGSDSPESAAREIKLWFRDDELFSWDQLLHTAIYE